LEQRRLAKREYEQAHRSNSDWPACAVRGMSDVTDVGRIDSELVEVGDLSGR
jgi:hypothetical protein